MEVSDPNFQDLIWRVAVAFGVEKASNAPAAVQPGLAGIITLADLKADIDALKQSSGSVPPGTALSITGTVTTTT
jgi:hypothetical protein